MRRARFDEAKIIEVSFVGANCDGATFAGAEGIDHGAAHFGHSACVTRG